MDTQQETPARRGQGDASGMRRPGLRFRAKSPHSRGFVLPRRRARNSPRGESAPQLSLGGEAGIGPRTAPGGSVRTSAVPLANLRDTSDNRESPGSSEELNRFSSIY